MGPLIARRPERLHVANRTADRARQLTDRFENRSGSVLLSSSSLAQTPAAEGSFDIVINATSAGLDQGVPDVPPRLLAAARCYDMVYGQDTAFCRWARKEGAAAVADGLGMLVEQAAEAFLIWRGVAPDTASVIAELRASQT
jgi:shikimate dehydrogenase